MHPMLKGTDLVLVVVEQRSLGPSTYHRDNRSILLWVSMEILLMCYR